LYITYSVLYLYWERVVQQAQHLQEIGGSVVKWSFVLRIKFSGGRQFSSPKSPTSCSCKTLWASLRNNTTVWHRQENHRLLTHLENSRN